ncbi:MAG: adenylate kinase [Candidatus Cloacimonetes bacterium 4572_55]|nr:MAG: adenylate kinase [Candidatus Cloacimonetes bacterium 4572_55]
MRLLFLGPPGCGKGTQAKHVVERTGGTYIASGDMLREEVKNQTDLGKKAKSYMKAGDLVPDDLIINMIRKKIERDIENASFLLDGFPRTIPQAEALGMMLDGLNQPLQKAVDFQVADDEIIDRITGRRLCATCSAVYHVKWNPPKSDGSCSACGGDTYQRPDDSVETVKNRLQVYHRQTEPLLQYYRDKGILVSINGSGDISEITARIEQSLGLTLKA